VTITYNRAEGREPNDLLNLMKNFLEGGLLYWESYEKCLAGKYFPYQSVGLSHKNPFKWLDQNKFPMHQPTWFIGKLTRNKPY